MGSSDYSAREDDVNPDVSFLASSIDLGEYAGEYMVPAIVVTEPEPETVGRGSHRRWSVLSAPRHSGGGWPQTKTERSMVGAMPVEVTNDYYHL